MSRSKSSIMTESRTPFTGVRTPVEVKVLSKSLVDIKKPLFRKLLKGALAYIEDTEMSPNLFAELKKEAAIDEEKLLTIFSGLVTILRAALRLPQSSLKKEAFTQDLKDLRIPSECIEDLVSAVYGPKRPSLDETLSKPSSHLPHLDRLRWRVDVAISNSTLNRILEPSVFMEMTLSDGTIRKFEVPVSKFQELRYNVSSVLREMEELEKRSILKITD